MNSLQRQKCAEALKAMAEAINAIEAMRDHCGNSRELSITLTNAETAGLWLMQADELLNKK